MNPRRMPLNKLMALTEYSMKPWHVRMCRWLRHMPGRAILGLLGLTWWLLRGCPYLHPHMLGHPKIKWNRRREAGLIWRKQTSIAHVNMGNSVSLADYIRGLKNR